MVKVLQFFFVITFIVSCSSKQGMTTSKIKLFTGKAFSAGGALASKANNGLVLYGRSLDGKSFLKKIDADTIDMVFPNGKWSFYAVSWEQNSPLSAFQGKTYCAKSENVQLSGVDVQINLNLTNANCADGAFTSAPATYSGNQVLPVRDFISCKDVSVVSSVSDQIKCARFSGPNNRGYATYIKIIVPEYKLFGNGLEAYNPAMQSACMKIDPTTDVPNMVNFLGLSANMLNLPESINGFDSRLRVYYGKNDSEACNDANGIDELILPSFDTPRSKSIMQAGGTSVNSVLRVYFQSNEKQLCQGPRVSMANIFAGGAGTKYSPYAICTPDQFNGISDHFSQTIGTVVTQDASFEVASDLDFGGIFKPIGGVMSGNFTPMNASGTAGSRTLFEGNNHRLKNIFVDCGTNAFSSAGLIREAHFMDVKNLTLENMAIVCADNTNQGKVGGLVGRGYAIDIDNVRLSGHIEGYANVGGLIGSALTSVNVSNSHVVLDLKTRTSYAGGFVGLTASLGNSSFINSSVKGVVRSPDSMGNYLGGMIGNIDQSSGSFTVTNSLSNVYIEGSSYLGGIAGEVAFSGSTSTFDLTGFYAKGAINTNYGGSKIAAGIVGNVSGVGSNSVNVDKGYTLFKINYSGTLSSTVGGSYGQLSAPSFNCSNYHFLYDSLKMTSSANCNNGSTYGHSLVSAMLSPLSTIATGVASTVMHDVASGLPRLAMEYMPSNLSINYLRAGECETGNVALLGAGTMANPYIICNQSQFTAMTSGAFYKLGDDIFFDTPILPFSGTNYRLNGNGFSLYGPTINVSSVTSNDGDGMFKYLDATSMIKNLKVYFSNVDYPSAVTINGGSGPLQLGSLAGFNLGTIENVKYIKSNYFVRGITNTLSSPATPGFGGLVGHNLGTISKVDLDINMQMGNSYPSGGLSLDGGASGKIYIGGLAGVNSGTIVVAGVNGGMNIAALTGVNQNIGSIVGLNKTASSYVSQVKVQGQFTVLGSSVLTSSTSIGPVAAGNEGYIKDIEYRSNYVSGNNYENTYAGGAGVVSNNTGYVARVVFAPTFITGFNVYFGGVSGGTTDESFCLYSALTNCYSTISGTFNTGLFTVTGSAYGGGNYSTLPSNSANWNMTSYPYPNSTFTWALPVGGSVPSLSRVESGDGEFDNLFN